MSRGARCSDQRGCLRGEAAEGCFLHRGVRHRRREELLVRAFGQAPADTVTASAVKSKMLALDSSFDQANYGCDGFRDLLTRLGHRVTTVGRSG